MAYRFRLRTLLIAVAVIAAVLAIAPYFFPGVMWVGNTNLQVTFLVKDADTGLPIEGATIWCYRHEGGFCLEDHDPVEEEFTLTTDTAGKAARMWTNCMCFGTKTLHRDTFAVHVPPLSFTAFAPNYESSKLDDLEADPHRRVVRERRGLATLDVVVLLHKTVQKAGSEFDESAETRGFNANR